MAPSNGPDWNGIRARVRELMERHVLPRGRQIGMWGGPGVGEPCSVCNLPIQPHELEFELRFEGEGAPIELRVHQRCHAAWTTERTACQL